MVSAVSIFSMPQKVYAISDNINAKSYILIDINGKILASKNEHEKREVASICKLMTSLIILEKIEEQKISIDDMVTISAKAGSTEGSQAFLDTGSQYSVGELLKSVIIASANDSAVALAEYVSGSEFKFVELMNLKAKGIGMNDTLYVNSTGLDGNKQYSSAYDTTIVLNEISKYDLYREYSQVWMDYIIHPSGRKTELVNTNRLIKYVDYCECGKTGFTDEAGYCLSSKGNIGGMELTCVVLGCKNSASRFTDTIALFNYARDNYSCVTVVDNDTAIENDTHVVYGKDTHIDMYPARNYVAIIKNGEENKYSFRYEIPDSLKAPVCAGDIVGSMYVLNGEDIVAKIDIISSNNIDRQRYGDIVRDLLYDFNRI